MAIELAQLVSDFADCLVEIDSSGIRFKEFQPGVGPFGEPQLVKIGRGETEWQNSLLRARSNEAAAGLAD